MSTHSRDKKHTENQEKFSIHSNPPLEIKSTVLAVGGYVCVRECGRMCDVVIVSLIELWNCNKNLHINLNFSDGFGGGGTSEFTQFRFTAQLRPNAGRHTHNTRWAHHSRPKYIQSKCDVLSITKANAIIDIVGKPFQHIAFVSRTNYNNRTARNRTNETKNTHAPILPNWVVLSGFMVATERHRNR